MRRRETPVHKGGGSARHRKLWERAEAGHPDFPKHAIVLPGETCW